jgi:hypothetical protein
MSENVTAVPADTSFMDWIKHSIERSLSVYVIGLAVGCIVFVGYGLYKGYVRKPDATQTIQRADLVDSRTFKQTFGCMTIQAMKAK